MSALQGVQMQKNAVLSSSLMLTVPATASDFGGMLALLSFHAVVTPLAAPTSCTNGALLTIGQSAERRPS